MNYQQIRLSYNDLSSVMLKKDKPFKYDIDYFGVVYEFIINYRENSTSAVVMSSGAYDFEKSAPPIFQRHSWAEDISATTVYFNDPTLYLGKIKLGWGYGTNERHYLVDISNILQLIFENLDIPLSNIIYYGSSGGGFMSLLLASSLRGKAVVNNPQTIVTNFFESFVTNLKNVACKEKEELILNRVNAIEFFKSTNYFPRIYYLQNSLSIFDMRDQFIPFLNGLMNLDSSLLNERVIIDLYADLELGHNPVNKQRTIELIEWALSGGF